MSSAFIRAWKEQGPKAAIVGDYDWKFLCTPRFPFCKKGKLYDPPPFYAYDEPLSLLVSLSIGLQHALTMSTNIITPALLVFNVVMSFFPEIYDPNLGEEQAANRERALDVAQYLVSASLICSGLGTMMQVSCIKIPFTSYQLGTGVLSTMGTANQYNAIFPVILYDIMSRGYTLEQAWGKLLGTIMVCVWLEAFISFIPYKILKRVCPPFVLGVTVTLIGVQLTGAGIKFWGGGVGCSRAPSADNPCLGNGEVQLGFGSAPYVAMGFSVYIIFLVVEIFGSPFFRNTMVIWGLLGGYAIAAMASHEGDRFVTTDRMKSSDAFTFLWVETFPIGVHGPAIIPMLFAFLVTAMETFGDITATEHASRLRPSGEQHSKRIQGGLLGDAVATFFAALGTTPPNTTLSQNNGIVALTRCASTSAGYSCGFWLLIFGVIAKIGAWILSIPDCVLGGALTFLFSNIIVSGIKLISLSRIDRRTHYIVAASLALGVGTALVPAFSSPGIGVGASRPNQWWPYKEGMSDAANSFRVGCMIAVNTPYFIGSITAIILNLIIPTDLVDDTEVEIEATWQNEDEDDDEEELLKKPVEDEVFKEVDVEDPDLTDQQAKDDMDLTETHVMVGGDTDAEA
ncbi:Putative purine permease C1399.01c [Seminavis robusta]|uniref:Purine permease C1399.01c n=1 Tax=Seminavis robusta TaxID=568900 RepID=A0A9N8EQV4_9STRA|nr:Putative purine permease C1399.01c [Seminavis robusta]|eukprot:Sro1463_g274810.1 Putative purine permease C1399.01c (626) ;mRNA; r:8632-10868